MDIVSIGGGPAGLWFAILFRQAFPNARIRVFERNRADDTFGWGVVFSDETLAGFAGRDAPSYRRITDEFVSWTDIETHYRGTVTTSTGHGFSGLSRRRLLNILHDRARELGVELLFEREVMPEEFPDADLILGADGVNSRVRHALAERFEPRIDQRHCKFAWFGTDKPLAAFTFVFEQTPHGLFQVHAYPFAEGLGTWIVECREEVWRAAGLDRMDERESAAWCERLFRPYLGEHRLLTNRSLWRSFPTIRCRTWHHGNVVLLGDAAHTAHFSIGSGTKLAMEDAAALVDAFVEHGTGDVPAALRAFEEARYVPVLKLQKAAQTSLEWFENSARYVVQEPLPFTFNLMTRSKRITYDNLAERDPDLVRRVRVDYAEREHAGVAPIGEVQEAPPPMFTPLTLRSLTLENRVVVSPMCQYSAQDGTVDDWHLVHLGSRAIGGAGLVITEMTNVSADGRITPGCAGMYQDAHVPAWRRIVDFVHRHSRSKIGIQLAHAGRKGSVSHPWSGADEPLCEGAWCTLAPSALPFRPHWPAPKEMDRADLQRVRDDFVRATAMAEAAGFDLIELHMAHGYLLSTFLSPATNRRRDAYGGDIHGRLRFPLEVFDAVRAAWPAEKPLAVRLTASDWLDGAGMTPGDAVTVARALREHGCDIVDVSSGGNVPESRIEYGRMYQVPFAEQVRYEAGIPVMAVGAILDADHVNTILAAGRADLCCLARPHLFDPYLTLHAAARYGYDAHWWPGQYLAGKPAPQPR